MIRMESRIPDIPEAFVAVPAPVNEDRIADSELAPTSPAIPSDVPAVGAPGPLLEPSPPASAHRPTIGTA